MLKNNLKIAWRTLKRYRVYSMINIVGLSIGICSCLVIFLITSHEMGYDNFHADSERIYRIVGSHKFKDDPLSLKGYVPCPVPLKVRQDISGLEEVAGFYNYDAKISVSRNGEEPKVFWPKKEGPSPIVVTEASYFSIFQYEWLAGDRESALEEPFMVVLTESAGRNYFGNVPSSDMTGRRVVYNDSLQLTVSGVVKDWNRNTDFVFTDFISLPTVRHSFLKNTIDLDGWGVWDMYSQAFVKLAPGVGKSQVETQFPEFVKDNFWEGNNSLGLQSLSEIHFDADYEDGYSRKAHLPTLYGLMGTAFFILLVAIINFVNLSTAQSFKRTKEIGIKKVLGVNKRGLKMQFYSEIFLLTLIAIILSAILLVPIQHLYESYIPTGLVLRPYSWYVWLFLLCILVLVTLLAGFYPASILSKYEPANCLKGEIHTSANMGGGLRKVLIVFQFAVSTAFIIGAMMVGKQLYYVSNTDMGFDKDAILNLHIGREKTPNNKMLLQQKLNGLPGLKAVSLHAETPLSQRHGSTSIKSTGSNGTGREILSSFEFADENYIDLYNIDIVAGRNLRPSDTINEFLINPTAARALGFTNPEEAIGKPFQVGIGGRIAPVVGIVDDFHSKSLHEDIAPFFITTNIGSSRTFSLKLLSQGDNFGQLESTMTDIKKVWEDVYPNKEFDLTFFDERIAALYDRERRTSKLINTAMGIAVVISCMGLFGLIRFTTEQRKKEIGIRKVLGAGVSNIVVMVAREFMTLMLISLIIAIPVAYHFIDNWLEEFAYRAPISWWVFLSAGLILVVLTVLTVGSQTLKAALANPVDSLQSE